MNKAEKELIKEALLLARDELAELVYTKEWFSSDAFDLIDSALEIIDAEKEE